MNAEEIRNTRDLVHLPGDSANVGDNANPPSDESVWQNSVRCAGDLVRVAVDAINHFRAFCLGDAEFFQGLDQMTDKAADVSGRDPPPVARIAGSLTAC